MLGIVLDTEATVMSEKKSQTYGVCIIVEDGQKTKTYLICQITVSAMKQKN